MKIVCNSQYLNQKGNWTEYFSIIKISITESLSVQFYTLLTVVTVLNDRYDFKHPSFCISGSKVTFPQNANETLSKIIFLVQSNYWASFLNWFVHCSAFKILAFFILLSVCLLVCLCGCLCMCVRQREKAERIKHISHLCDYMKKCKKTFFSND